MDKIEASGRTLEEALQMAAHELRVPVEGVEYEIVEEGSKGFLGLGQSPTVLQAWVKEGFTPGEYSEAAPATAETEPAAVSATPEAAAGEDAFVDSLVKTVTEILGAMDMNAKPVVKSVSAEEVEVNLEGSDVAILIGKHGQTLDALQYLISIAANKGYEKTRRVILDAEGYRQRHKESLEKIAREYAKGVKERGQEAELEPQSARDRRIIHMALADDPDVYTYSEGAGDNRHVVISPKK